MPQAPKAGTTTHEQLCHSRTRMQLLVPGTKPNGRGRQHMTRTPPIDTIGQQPMNEWAAVARTERRNPGRSNRTQQWNNATRRTGLPLFNLAVCTTRQDKLRIRAKCHKVCSTSMPLKAAHGLCLWQPVRCPCPCGKMRTVSAQQCSGRAGMWCTAVQWQGWHVVHSSAAAGLAGGAQRPS